MNPSRQCYLICGNDTYRSYKAFKAIEKRFLAKQESMVDYVKFDMDETNLETLRQALLTVPFLVAHRLFVIRNVFSSGKTTLEGVVKLLEQVSDSTVVVFYESKPCDKRLTLYHWLQKNARIQEFVSPTSTKLEQFIEELAAANGVTIDKIAVSLLAGYYPADTWRMSLEVKKLASFALSQSRTKIHAADVSLLCVGESESTPFGLTDALRDHNLKAAVSHYQEAIQKEDPMFIAGIIGGYIRTLAKIALCCFEGVTRSDEIARQTKLNPYVVKLSLPTARMLGPTKLKRCYAELIRFDSMVKNGSVAPELGVLLLIIRLHGNLKAR